MTSIEDKRRKGYRGIPRRWLLALLLILYLFLGLISQSHFHWTYSGVRLSLADCLVGQANSILFSLLVVPVTLLWLQWEIKNELLPVAVVRRKSRQAIWMRQVGKTGLWAVTLAVGFGVLTTALGLFFSTAPINWDSQTSAFFVQTQQTLEIPFGCVAVITVVSVAVHLFVSMALFLLCWWHLRRSAVVWILYLAVTCAGLFLPYAGMLTGRIDLSYSSWLTNAWGPEWVGALIMGAVWTVAGLVLSAGKEFLHNGFSA